MGLFRRTTELQPDSDATEYSMPVTSAPSTTSITAPAPTAPAQALDIPANGATETVSTPTDAELQELRETVSEIHRVLSEFSERGSAQEKVFDTLHSELQDYKNDFIYEHLKPVLWPLLFLFDSLEQYAREIVGRATSTGGHQVDAKEVLDHLKFFRGQLVESLRICEVTPMKQPTGAIDLKCHKGIGVEPVQDPSEDNTVRRVVRTGWFLNGKVLRHAEVIVGKYADPAKANGQANGRTAAPR
jgi:molecular chaperone GrpE (heat shock protein)